MMFDKRFAPSSERCRGSEFPTSAPNHVVHAFNGIRGIRKIEFRMIQIRAEISDITEEFSNNASKFPRTIAAFDEFPKMIFQFFHPAAILERKNLSCRLIDFFSCLSSRNGGFPSSPSDLQLGDEMEMTALKNPSILFRNPF